MRRIMAAVLVLGLGSTLISASPLQQPDKRIEQLSKERERLKRTNDPVDRTKTDIRISEILLTFVGDAVKDGDPDALSQRLTEYREAIEDAHQTMTATGRDANKKPGGFKDLEMSLRRQLVRLKDLGQALTYEQRDVVDKVRQEASDIQD